jgi:hypothetical protein
MNRPQKRHNGTSFLQIHVKQLAIGRKFAKKLALLSRSRASIPPSPTGSWEPVGLWMNRSQKRDNSATFLQIFVK